MSEGLSEHLSRAMDSLVKAIWDTDADNLPFWRAKATRIVRITVAVGRDFLRGQLSLRATSLVFTTLLSLAPLLAVAFSVLKGFEVHNELQPALQRFLEPLGEKSVEITERIIGFVENVKAGVIGSVGLGVLFYTIISLMHKIEQAFNFTWHVSQHRSMSERFSDYLSVIIVGPVLVFSSLGITATVVGSATFAGLAAIQPFGWIIGLLGTLLPYVMIVGAFTFIYVFMPNTRVQLRSAVAGALVAGIMWQSTGWLFAAFVANSPNYAAIYSAFATLVIFMIWLYVSWLVLLVGASVAFYHQHPEYLSKRPGQLALSNRMGERLALMVVNRIGASYYHDRPAPSRHALARRLDVPVEMVGRVLRTLEQARVIKSTGDDPPAFLPARPPEDTSLKNVLDAIRATGEHVRFNVDSLSGEPTIDRVFDRLDAAAEQALEGLSIKDLAIKDLALSESDAADQPKQFVPRAG
ncbi:MAG: YhjD/YihY/BrkB family envelope integrity protein [Sphingomonadales bacterium]